MNYRFGFNLRGKVPDIHLAVLLVVFPALVLTGCGRRSSLISRDAPAVPELRSTIPPFIERTPEPSSIALTTATPTVESGASEMPATLSSPQEDFLSSAFPPSSVEYVIPLTVRHAGADRAALFFELSEPSAGRLIIRPQALELSYGGRVELDPAQTRHLIQLEDLAPGMDFAALVLLGEGEDLTGFSQPVFDGEAWGTVNFSTQGEIPLRIGVLGDASFGDDATTQLVALMAGMDLDFVIHTGDVVYETDSSDLVSSYVGKFFRPFSPLLHQGPVYTVMGNHDYDASVQWQGAPFYDYAFPPFDNPAFAYPNERRGNQFYAVPVGDIQFLFLDSQAIFGAGGRQAQDTWLKERLADPRFRVTIPVLHVSPYSSSAVHPDDGDPVRLSWNYLFEGANVPLVLSGHFHHYERLGVNGITYVVTGGGSSVLYAQGAPVPESQLFVARTHFVLLEIYEDRIDMKAISKEGDTFDQAQILLD